MIIIETIRSIQYIEYKIKQEYPNLKDVSIIFSSNDFISSIEIEYSLKHNIKLKSLINTDRCNITDENYIVKLSEECIHKIKHDITNYIKDMTLDLLKNNVYLPQIIEEFQKISMTINYYFNPNNHHTNKLYVNSLDKLKNYIYDLDLEQIYFTLIDNYRILDEYI